MTTLDPVTNRPLPADAYQRVLYVTPKVHVYQIPPLASNKGYTAATWTTRPAIFTARLRVIETAIPSSKEENVSTAVLLEDGNSGELFAAAPYNNPSVVANAVDSSRFFAVRVVGEGGMKATLGIGFEERSDAFDFGVALQDAGKVLGFESGNKPSSKKAAAREVEAEKRDYSLKQGETITVNIGGKGRRGATPLSDATNEATGAVPFLPPPPSAADMKRQSLDEASAQAKSKLTAEELGFDDGEFGEFQ